MRTERILSVCLCESACQIIKTPSLLLSTIHIGDSCAWQFLSLSKSQNTTSTPTDAQKVREKTGIFFYFYYSSHNLFCQFLRGAKRNTTSAYVERQCLRKKCAPSSPFIQSAVWSLCMTAAFPQHLSRVFHRGLCVFLESQLQWYDRRWQRETETDRHMSLCEILLPHSIN